MLSSLRALCIEVTRRLSPAGFTLLLLLPSPRAAAAPDRELGQPYFEIFDPRAYRGHTQVWRAEQDASGLLYFGNYGGVLVYDGARWDRIDVPGTSFVRALALDADDTLWIGGVDELGYARTDETGRRVFVSLKDQLPAEARAFGDLWRVVMTPRGPVFQSNTWLLRWDGARVATLALAEAGRWQIASAGGVIWVSSERAGWFRLDDDGAQLTLGPNARPAAYARSSILFVVREPSARGAIFGTSNDALVRWDGTDFAPWPTEIDDVLKQRRLYRATALSHERIAVTTLQAGAFILDLAGRLLARLDEDAGLPDNGVIGALAARDDVLWLCLQRGMVRVDARPWVTWFGPARGAPRTTLDPAVRFHGEFLLCTDGGLMRVEPARGTSAARLTHVAAIPDPLFGLAVIDDDEVVGYGDNGLVSWNGRDRRPLPGTPATAFDFVAARGQPGRWFALVDGHVCSYRRESGQWVAEGTIAGLDGVRTLAVEPDGTWWLGTPSSGVLRVTFPAADAASPGKPAIDRLTAGRGLPTGHGWARVAVDERGPLLQCEQGLFRLDRARREFVPTAEFGARFSDGTTTARGLIDTKPGDGRWMVARPAGEAELVTTLDLGIARADGWRRIALPVLNELEDVSDLRYESDRDVLWIGGHSGLVRIDVARWRTAPPEPAPAVGLRGIETDDGKWLPVSGNWALPFARRSLRIAFAAPALAGDPAARYESTLFGSGEPVVQTDGTPERKFSALAPGGYRLQLRAARADGDWSAPVELAFSVLPPWWSSAWAWLAYAALAAAAVAAIVAWRTRTLRHRAIALECIVAERTEELRRSNAELARLHRLELDEKIAARLAEEKARLEVLRYQLNPHFLFNAFNTLHGLITEEPAAAGALTLRLSDFCRQSFVRGSEVGTVREELAMLRAYLGAEHARWGDSLRVAIEADPPALDRLLPPFLLLPLVENAIKYGSHTSPGLLELRLTVAAHGDDGLAIEVANTGAWLERDAAGSAPPGNGGAPVSTGIGLENIRRRLARLYPDAHSLAIAARDGWVRVRLALATAPREPALPASRSDY
ncbi:MAG TPA: histidine kinase [Opitutus sp.]|nr:histidine kinase [Opitutus sp.]